jgi:hypothetical protein
MNLRTPYPGQSRPQPTGKPTWEAKPGCECPNCGCELAVVSCPVEPPAMLRTPTGKAAATYFGCPACPYASAAMIVAAS